VIPPRIGPIVAGLLLSLSSGCVAPQAALGVDDKASSQDPDTASSEFFVLDDGTDLHDHDHSILDHRARSVPDGTTVRRIWGRGENFDPYRSRYCELKDDPDAHWAVMDLNTDLVVGCSPNADTPIYGASLPKAFAVAALLYHRDGALDDQEWPKVISTVGRSCNKYWDDIEGWAGGAAGMDAFTNHLGYEGIDVVHEGDWNTQIDALTMARFFSDMHHRRFTGADAMWKLMSTCRTGYTRAQRFIPNNVLLGGKTGSWDLANHDVRYIEDGGRLFAISVLTNLRYSENVAVLHGGLFYEYVRGEDLCGDQAEANDADHAPGVCGASPARPPATSATDSDG